jgi:hypothetical protein
MPKSVTHGSQYKGLRQIKSASAQAMEQVGKTNEGLQAGIYTSKPGGIATQYGKDGQVYTIDTSNISKNALFKMGKDKVLNTSKVPDSLIQTLNRKIDDLTVAGPTKESFSLEIFKDNLIQDKGITFVNPAVKNFLVDNNYKVIKTKLFKNPHFILLDDAVAAFAQGGPNDLPVVNPIPDVGSITPISPFEMTEAFGGPLYQMLNPGAKQLVDRLGLRGQGLSGAAAMAFGPQKKVSGVSAGLQKLFEMFPKIKGNPLEVIKETPKIIKKLQNKVTDQKINVSSGATRDKLLKTRSENQELIKELKKYENEADNYFKNILSQPGSMTFDPKFANTVKEYIKIKDPKLINIGLTKNFDNQNILIALKKSEILDDIKKLNKIEVLQKPNSTFADKLLASELKKETKFKNISEALEELDKLQ